ncbi:hypothetical protein NHX12_026069 [Muraenolepis orangiensis]|uniref:Pleckstrin homology domain-containing family G member 3 n=1 Tax=Muraenolepis orangiensis TaxID=630683 RepID=A0A9Q0EHY2_9TELE|nr:hypothetical protein NHX12_026069 [Muraenolepis orangiensis]
MGKQKLLGSVCRGNDWWAEGRWGRNMCGVAVGPSSDAITARRLGFRTKHRLAHWLDSPRLSAASLGSTERTPSATPSDGSDPPSAADRRPLSLVSTLSSGSASSRDDCQAPPPSGTPSPALSGEDIDLEPIEGHSAGKGRGFNGNYVDRVVMEIIETERMYVKDLRMIVEDYLAHIIDQADLSVGPELVCALFGNIEDIYEFNSELLQSLDQCDNDPVAIARCFVTKSEYFEIYTQYCTNYPNSVAALTECMGNKSLAKFFRERQASLKRSLPLGSYLLKPVQRILKYHLLLQEIAKHSDQQGADYEVVEEAIYTMTGEVQSLLLHWKDSDLTTYGELILEGTFKVHRARTERTLFLFDRMLLITKRRGEHYVYKDHISCSTLMLMENAKDSLSFSVTQYKQLKHPHTVQARNLEEKKLWSHHIKRIILENHQAIIPQKAKEAILEMDSIYPSKYRYSPDRLKKALSVQSDELPPESFQVRRKSEPTKQLFESTKAVLKGSLERLTDPEEVGQDSDDADDDMVFLEDYQVADFASSMLAAISCWHSRARALLSLGDATEEEIKSIAQEEENHQRPHALEDPPVQLQDSDSKTRSSEDRAGAIAQHFAGSTRRSSLSSDDARSPGCLSPRLASRTGSRSDSVLSPGAEPRMKSSPFSDTPEVFLPADPNLLMPWEDIKDCGSPTGRGGPQLRDSFLSRHDQLLIGKIKSYYEVAESQDPAFCLRRRESLTSIPTGLVRSSVSHFNCAPSETLHPGEGVRVKPSPSAATTAAGDDQASGEAEPEKQNQGGTIEAGSCPQQGSAVTVGGSVGYAGALARSSVPPQEEEFRSSSEMIQIWQAMERNIGRNAVRRREIPIIHNQNSDPGSAGTEETPVLSEHRTRTAGPAGPAGSLKETLKQWGGEGPVHRPPRVLELRGRAPSQPSRPEKNDPDSAKSKVLSLARQYSQRIKTSKPVVRPQGADPRLAKRTLPCVLEESESSGKDNLSIPLAQPSPTESGVPGPDLATRAPSTVPTGQSAVEEFCWPDVRELRSKYGPSDGPPTQLVGRSLSVPERMTAAAGRAAEFSGVPLSGPQLEGSGRFRLHRTKSLDHRRLSGLQRSRLEKLPEEVSNGSLHSYYVSAEAVLPGDGSRTIVIVEKLPEEPAVETREPVGPVEPVEPAGEENDGENFIQIRSPTSREKISIMAVIDRCKAYQETDEYKLREEEAGFSGGRGKEPDRTATSSAGSEVPESASNQHSVVKNLREKFQKLS